MNDLLLMDPPSRGERIFFFGVSSFCMVFGGVFAGMPLVHLWRGFLSARSPWPLLLFVVMGFLIIYVGIRYLAWALGFRFAINRKQRCFGYYRNGLWLWRRDLGEVVCVVTKPGHASTRWPWVICFRRGKGKREECVLVSYSASNTEAAAFDDCLPTARKLANFLGVELCHEEWSEGITKERAQGV